MASDAKRRSEIARSGGVARYLKAPSGAAMTEAARRAGPGQTEYWYLKTDPSLPEQERQSKAEAARDEYMKFLSGKAAGKRRDVSAADMMRKLAGYLLERADQLESDAG